MQARLTAGQMRFKSSIAKMRGLCRCPIPDHFADVKNLPVPLLMELDAALRRQSLLLASYAKKAVAISSSTAGGLLARRAAVVLDNPDAHFSRILSTLLDGPTGLDSLTVLERTFGIFPVDSWAFLAALFEYTSSHLSTFAQLNKSKFSLLGAITVF